MSPRHALPAALLLISLVACKRSEPAPTPAPAPAPTKTAAAPDPWTPDAAPRPAPIEKPLLWRADKAGHTTYFLGTMHLGVDAEQRLPAWVWSRLDAAPAFAMETDTANAGTLSMSRPPGSKTLREELGPTDWATLERAIGADVAARIDTLKPMVAATMLALRGLPPTPPMDGVLLGRALNRKKKVVYLELASTQTAILEKHMTLRAVQLMLRDVDKGEKIATDMVASYLAGDDAAILAQADAQRADALAFGYTSAEYDQQMEEILYQRNASWIPALEKLHAEASGAFVAVGALHLVGPRSVLDLLEKRGYAITRATSETNPDAR